MPPSPIKAPPPGIYPDVPAAEYHAWDALNSSGMKQLLISPRHYVESKRFSSDAACLVQGSATHTCVLEPEKFADQYAWPAEKRAKRSKADKEWWASFEAEAATAGKTVLTIDQYDTASRQRDAVRAHPLASELLSQPGAVEVSLSWLHDGLAVKARCDYLLDDPAYPHIIDLKTCTSASPRGFRSAVFRYQYHLQAALYCYGAGETLCDHEGPRPTFTFIAVEKKWPYHVAVYQLDDGMLRDGCAHFVRAIDAYRSCQTDGIWPGYNGDEIGMIALEREEYENDGAGNDNSGAGAVDDGEYIDF